VAKKLLHAPQMALKKDTSGDGVPLVTAVQRLFDLTVVESVEDPGADAPGGEREAAAATEVAAGAPMPTQQKKASGS
jgi:hypothetical protein